jgi:hypothetical protein
MKATRCLGDPELADDTVFGRIKTFHQPVSKKRPCLARQRERLLRDLFDSHTHIHRIPIDGDNLKPNLPAGASGVKKPVFPLPSGEAAHPQPFQAEPRGESPPAR